MRIGPKMRWVMQLTQERRTLIDIADHVGPHGSLRYGYAIIDRTILAGLVAIHPPLPGRRGVSIKITRLGLDELAEAAHESAGA